MRYRLPALNDHTPSSTRGLSYRDAGVDIDAGNALVTRLAPLAARTRRPEVLTGLGGFGGLFQLDLSRYRTPVLVSGTDGVGTKLRLAIDTGRHADVGIDLVAMCVNDIVVCGAEPLFFLDYYATGQLSADLAATVIGGIAQGCEQAGAALIGGETAEMPGMYPPGDYDLAGFAVGIVERDALIDGRQVAAGDTLIGLASSGLHANGFSLARAIVTAADADLNAALPGSADPRSLARHLLTPTRIYVKSILALRQRVTLKAIAHITGGGLPDNLPRVLPSDCGARIDWRSWRRPPLFDWLQAAGGVTTPEMLRTFNCGVGMVLVVAAEDTQATLNTLAELGEQAWVLGDITATQGVAFSHLPT